jgi:ABC-type lipoprotein release transport system permease subunit
MRMTPGAGPLGVGVWLAAPLVMTIVVAAASLLPARRALMVNPLASVRDRLQL